MSPAALLLLAPIALVYAGLFLAPLGYLLWQSLHRFSLTTGVGGFSFANYVRLLSDPYYLGMLGESCKLAALTSLICLCVAYPLAYAMRRAPDRLKGVLLLGILAPLLVSVVVRSFGWVVILGEDGLFNQALRFLGFAAAKSNLFTEGAVLTGLVHIFVPFMVLAVYAALQKLDLSLVRAAGNLGAPPWRVFVEIVFPLSLPGVIAGLSTVFALAMGAYVTVAVLGGAKLRVLAVQAYTQSISMMNWQLGSAIGVVLLVATTLLLFAFQRLAARLVW